MCSSSIPYSSSYETDVVSYGSFSGFRTGMNPAPHRAAIAAPRMNPRASGATTKSTSSGRACCESASTACSSAAGSANSGVASLNTIPGWGKSGMSRISSLSSAIARQDRLPRVKQVADGVWHLDTFFLPNSINAYLIEDVLVDAGTRHSGGKILKQIGSHKVSAHALTHSHPDHQGATHEVCSTLDIPLWVGERDADAAEDPDLIRQRQPGHPMARFYIKIFIGPGHPVDRQLARGRRGRRLQGPRRPRPFRRPRRLLARIRRRPDPRRRPRQHRPAHGPSRPQRAEAVPHPGPGPEPPVRPPPRGARAEARPLRPRQAAARHAQVRRLRGRSPGGLTGDWGGDSVAAAAGVVRRRSRRDDRREPSPAPRQGPAARTPRARAEPSTSLRRTPGSPPSRSQAHPPAARAGDARSDRRPAGRPSPPRAHTSNPPAARPARTINAPRSPTSQTPSSPRCTASPVRLSRSRSRWPTRSPSSPSATPSAAGSAARPRALAARAAQPSAPRAAPAATERSRRARSTPAPPAASTATAPAARSRAP